MTALAERRASKARREKSTRSDAVINVRVPVKTRDLIDTAAAVTGKTRTQFVLDSARQQAIDVLLDQRLFALTNEQFAAFMDILENPTPATSKLRKLFDEKSPWET